MKIVKVIPREGTLRQRSFFAVLPLIIWTVKNGKWHKDLRWLEKIMVEEELHYDDCEFGGGGWKITRFIN